MLVNLYQGRSGPLRKNLMGIVPFSNWKAPPTPLLYWAHPTPLLYGAWPRSELIIVWETGTPCSPITTGFLFSIPSMFILLTSLLFFSSWHALGLYSVWCWCRYFFFFWNRCKTMLRGDKVCTREVAYEISSHHPKQWSRRYGVHSHHIGFSN